MNDVKKSPKIRFDGFIDAWEQRKFGEIFKKRMERNGGQFDKTKWISVAKMYYQQPEKVTSNNIDTRTYVMRKGDIAFEGHPNQDFKYGRFVENDIGDGVISELFPIYQHKGEYDLLYWKYAIQLERVMQSKLVRCIEISYTSSNKLNEKFFLEERILVPCLEEQKKIGSFLSNLDNLISFHQRKCEKLKCIKKSMLEKMFPKNGEKFPEIRFKGFTDAWEQRKLVDLTARIIVGLATSVTPYYRKSGVPLLRNMNIKENYLDDSDILYLDEEYARNNQSKMIHTNDVLTVHTGANIGLTCLAPKEYEGCLSFTTLITTPKDTVLNCAYLMQFMNSTYGKKRINSIITAGGKPNLNSGDLEKLEVPYPKIDEQIQIGKFLSNLDDLITLHQRKYEKLTKIKKSFLQKLFV